MCADVGERTKHGFFGGRKLNRGKDWYDVKQQIRNNPGSELSGVTPGAEFTGYTQTSGKPVAAGFDGPDFEYGSRKSEGGIGMTPCLKLLCPTQRKD